MRFSEFLLLLLNFFAMFFGHLLRPEWLSWPSLDDAGCSCNWVLWNFAHAEPPGQGVGPMRGPERESHFITRLYLQHIANFLWDDDPAFR